VLIFSENYTRSTKMKTFHAVLVTVER